jgi:hypothetical protein
MFSRSILAGIALAMAATDVMGFAPTATLSPSLARSGRAASLPAVVGRKSLVGPLPESPAESSRFLSEGVACCCLSILSTPSLSICLYPGPCGHGGCCSCLTLAAGREYLHSHPGV